MAVCHVSVTETFADSWLQLVAIVRGRRPDDEMRRATMMLTKSIEATSRSEHEIGAELADLSCRARTLRSKHVKADLVALLTSSKHKRLRLQQTVRKRLALEQHLETLQGTLLNQQVMSSVKHTAEVLKSMGLERELSRVDEINMDLQDSLADVGAIQDGLASGLFPADDDIDLDSEMELLMQLDPAYAGPDPTYAAPDPPATLKTTLKTTPPQQNRMHHEQEERAPDAADAVPALAAAAGIAAGSAAGIAAGNAAGTTAMHSVRIAAPAAALPPLPEGEAMYT